MMTKNNNVKELIAKRNALIAKLKKASGIEVFSLSKEIQILNFNIDLLADDKYKQIVSELPDTVPLTKLAE